MVNETIPHVRVDFPASNFERVEYPENIGYMIMPLIKFCADGSVIPIGTCFFIHSWA
jgi:hypothetical protein